MINFRTTFFEQYKKQIIQKEFIDIVKILIFRSKINKYLSVAIFST